MGSEQSSISTTRVTAVVLPVALVAAAAYWWSNTLAVSARDQMASNVIGRMFTSEALPTNEPMSYPDTDGDMVADPPSDPAECIAPTILMFSYVATEEEGTTEATWRELLAALSEKAGREVEFVRYKTADEQLGALKKGELHIAGLNTGLVPVAVNRDGFVPLCTFGRAEGTFGYTMELLVPAGSPIESPADIKGHKVTFTQLDSNSGCKAPLVLLMNQFDLRPERDYQWGFSQGHEDSIKGIATKEFEVAPVASDVLLRMIEKGEVDPQAVKSIYTSERFPPATIGYAYNLTPELRDGIRATLLEFDWTDTGLAMEFGPEAVKFVPVSYKDDWANMRRIDDVIAAARKPRNSGS
jgi:phosphonate transport system substrate-binding protein